MESRKDFVTRINNHLKTIDPATLLFNENEFWLIQQAYEYIEFYAVEKRLFNTAIALPLARGLHDGSYRKYGVVIDGETHRLPYFVHCLMVCRMLVDMNVPVSHDEEDYLLAAALCHDLIEDIPFENQGRELVTSFGLDEEVYNLVLLVSKKSDFTSDEEERYFEEIKKHPLALLLKLSDRGNNVEDLYNMSNKKLKEYTKETERYFFPMSDYGSANYREIQTPILILRDKISILTNVSKLMISQLEKRNDKLRKERNQLKIENHRLREQWKELYEEEMNHG